jgi:hypothetical protein
MTLLHAFRWFIETRGRNCNTNDGVLMITCSGVHMITVTEFVGKHLHVYITKKRVKMVIFIFQKLVLCAKLYFND